MVSVYEERTSTACSKTFGDVDFISGVYKNNVTLEECQQECTSYDWCVGIRMVDDWSTGALVYQCWLLTSEEDEWDSALEALDSTLDGWESANEGNWAPADEWEESEDYSQRSQCYEKTELGTVV